VNAATIRPVDRAGQTQSTADLFLIFVGANIVATTFQVGASLVPSFSLRTAIAAFVAELYDARGPFRGVLLPGMAAWTAGAAAYFLAGSAGGTIPAFAVSVLVYWVGSRVL